MDFTVVLVSGPGEEYVDVRVVRVLPQQVAEEASNLKAEVDGLRLDHGSRPGHADSRAHRSRAAR